MVKSDTRIDITVVILTYNGETYIAQILKAIYEQKIDKKFEILVIDSGSSDTTLEKIAAYPKVRLHEIPNSEFGHGRTRNFAAEMANGDIVVYLTHDAIPAHELWLYELTRPFDLDKNIMAVMGKQIPRGNCFPLLKYEIQHVFGGFGPDFGVTLFYKDTFINKDQAVYDAVGFYSDANSATRKAFLKQIPYRDVPYAEDQLFGRDVIEAGYIKAYAPRGSVIHSNDLKLREYKHRMFDEALALKNTGINTQPVSRKLAVKLTIRGTLGDTVRILRDRTYSKKRKLYWIVLNPLYHIEKWRGVRRATQELSPAAIEKLSLEKKRKVSRS